MTVVTLYDDDESHLLVVVPRPTEEVVVTPLPTPGVVLVREGVRGDPGPAGPSAYEVALDNGFEGSPQEWLDSLRGGLVSHVHAQGSPESVWTIEHPLPFRPAVSVADSAGTVVEGDVRYLDAHTIQISFASGFSGTAYLS